MFLAANTHGYGRPCRPRHRTEPDACCVRPDVPIDRPDPAIYSQKQVLSTGGTPTWDSPDIFTNWWHPWKLMPESRVTVRNLSTTASAANVQVQVSFSAFGIGMPVTALSSIAVSLAPLASTELLFPLTQAMLGGDQKVSVFVRLIASSDAEPGNNEGEQAILSSLTSYAGRVIEFDIPVRNAAPYPRSMSFVTFANTLGFTVNPSSYNFGPLEQIVVRGRITVDPGIHGTSNNWKRQDATMAAFAAGGELVGGITYVVHIDD